MCWVKEWIRNLSKNQSGVDGIKKKNSREKKNFDNLYLTHRFSSFNNVKKETEVNEVFIIYWGLTCFSGKMCPVCAFKMKIILCDAIHAFNVHKHVKMTKLLKNISALNPV